MGGGGHGRKGCYYSVDAYRWPPGPSPNAGPLHLPCFSLATMKFAWIVIQYGWTMSEQMNRTKQILNVKVKCLFIIPKVSYPGKNEPYFTSSYTQKNQATRRWFSSHHLDHEKCLKRWASVVTLNHQFHCVLVTPTQMRKIGSSPFKRRRSPVSQMAGWDLDTFGVFLSSQSWETLTLTAARGGIGQFNGPLFVT